MIVRWMGQLGVYWQKKNPVVLITILELPGDNSGGRERNVAADFVDENVEVVHGTTMHVQNTWISSSYLAHPWPPDGLLRRRPIGGTDESALPLLQAEPHIQVALLSLV